MPKDMSKPTEINISKQQLFNIVKQHYAEQLKGLAITEVTANTYSEFVNFDLAPELELVFPAPEVIDAK